MTNGDLLDGDWYLQIGDQELDPTTLPRYAFRQGRVFLAGGAERVG
jgi:hypothetical protein